MQKALLTTIIIFLSLRVLAQGMNLQDTSITHYVFSEFLPGVVKKKTGQEVHVPLNYNTLTEEMIFVKDTQRFAMIELEQIDSVLLGGKVFVPGKDMFYEQATHTPVPLYIESKTTVLQDGLDIGYGAKTESGSVSKVSSLIGSTAVYKLKLPAGYRLVDHTSYWVYNGGKFIKIGNFKKLQSIFPAKAAAIKAFVAQNNIAFSNREDMVKLIEFCNQPG